ncbi:hypothetical protein JI62_02470 [Halomonas campaniensis]|uniref:Uncharacterized protein n=1 Tax=Halomonas campaniensis TaxID=213554 RepID=A0A246S449_9GAMM|nr:hypothetical protein JI62_02470 [Halomonas campaniensis]
MTAMLSGWGCEVFTATSIGEDKSILRNMDGDPDAILAGYQLLLKPVKPAALRALLARTFQANRAARLALHEKHSYSFNEQKGN